MDTSGAEQRARIEEAVAEKRRALEAELTEAKGRVSARDALLLDAICDTERIRLEAMAAVEQKGLRERYTNGRQSVERENKSVTQAHKASASLARLLSALYGRGRAAAAPEPDGEPDELDNY